MKNLDEKTKQKIIALILAIIPDTKIYLFGSRARGTNSESADIDIALDAGKRLENRDVYEISCILKETSIIYNIDVVDLYQVSDLMRERILKDRIIWKN